MDFASLIPVWLDAFLIAPFRWPADAHAGMWLGSALLAFYCLLIGQCTAAALYSLHRKYYAASDSEMLRYHKLSMDALHAGNKDAYLAANTLAREHFGKSFFAGASRGLTSLWPLPLALGWMSLCFEGIALYAVPVLGYEAGYVFVLLTAYIVLRLCWGKVKRCIPPQRHLCDKSS
ncbi:MAG: hypothetical protein LBC94_08820 [Desulfovibrio sp.]|jgi:hypothetical protein|nr:hypothetical protein [Desulfovibrio sp.]